MGVKGERERVGGVRERERESQYSYSSILYYFSTTPSSTKLLVRQEKNIEKVKYDQSCIIFYLLIGKKI